MRLPLPLFSSPLVHRSDTSRSATHLPSSSPRPHRCHAWTPSCFCSCSCSCACLSCCYLTTLDDLGCQSHVHPPSPLCFPHRNSLSISRFPYRCLIPPPISRSTSLRKRLDDLEERLGLLLVSREELQQLQPRRAEAKGGLAFRKDGKVATQKRQDATRRTFSLSRKAWSSITQPGTTT